MADATGEFALRASGRAAHKSSRPHRRGAVSIPLTAYPLGVLPRWSHPQRGRVVRSLAPNRALRKLAAAFASATPGAARRRSAVAEDEAA